MSLSGKILADKENRRMKQEEHDNKLKRMLRSLWSVEADWMDVSILGEGHYEEGQCIYEKESKATFEAFINGDVRCLHCDNSIPYFIRRDEITHSTDMWPHLSKDEIKDSADSYVEMSKRYGLEPVYLNLILTGTQTEIYRYQMCKKCYDWDNKYHGRRSADHLYRSIMPTNN